MRWTTTDKSNPTVSNEVNNAVKKHRSQPATAIKITVPTIVNNIHAPPPPMPAAKVSQPDAIASTAASEESNHSRRPILAGRKRRMVCDEKVYRTP